MPSNINAAKIVVFLDFGGVSQLLQMLIFLKCELCDRPFADSFKFQSLIYRIASRASCSSASF